MGILKRLLLTDFSKIRCLSTTSSRVKRKDRVSQWQSVIGLEIHAQIQSNSKLFSGAATKFAAPINSQVSLFDAALPGTLPVLNKQCIQSGVLTALALNCKINPVSRFDRKHYFYADLPAGYQITQQRQPLAVKGQVSYLISKVIPGQGKKFEHKTARITQLQLEQDSGKSLHDAEDGISLIDLNRAGVGLMEIVTEPDFTSAEEAAAFVKELQTILQTLGTCDGKMAEGSLRVDASVSLHLPGESLGVRAEVKNINSIRNVAKAIEYEIQRQAEILDGGGHVVNETRSFDHETDTTISMRDKERLHDYRFLPEPNLPPLHVYSNEILATLPKEQIPSPDQIVNMDILRSGLRELPKVKREKLCDMYGLTLEHAAVLVSEPGMDPLFRKLLLKDRNPKRAANFVQNEVLALLNSDDIMLKESPLNEDNIGDILDLIEAGTISLSTAKKVLKCVYEGDSRSPSRIVRENRWSQVTDLKKLDRFCQDTLDKNPDLVEAYQKGKTKVLNALIGNVQKETQGRADATKVKEIMIQKLTS